MVKMLFSTFWTAVSKGVSVGTDLKHGTQSGF